MEHRQCVLEHENTTTVVWVPITLAKFGQLVRIKDDDRAWRVQFVSSLSKEESILQRAARWFKRFSYGHEGKKSGLPEC